jgi:hypothetical protein
MSLNQLESGYIGSPEKWRIFLRKFAISQEITNKYHEQIDYEKRMNKPLSTALSVENFNKDFSELGVFSKEDFSCTSFADFKNSGIFDLLKYVDYVSCNILNIVDLLVLSKSDYKNKNFFNKLIYEDVPDHLYYSYNTWQDKVYQYNGESNPEFMAADYNMMLGELGFGFQRRKKASCYDKALVVGSYYDHATGFLLPNELTKDGEMEAWFINAEDVHRFRSFSEMMIWNLIAGFEYSGAELQDFLQRIGVNEILDLDTLASNAYVQAGKT